MDVFGDTVFTARAGDAYLISDFDPAFDAGTTEFLYVTSKGPETFTVETPADDPPFTSNCQPDAVDDYYAAFTDVSFFSDEALTTPLCDIAAGTALPSTGSQGFILTSGDIFGPAIYEVFLGPFSADCGDAESGYVSVPETQIFGSTTWLVPLASILKAR